MSVKVLLNLKAPLQSWGEASKYMDRPTLDHPTKSGVIGILCAAMGISMKKEHAKVQELSRSIKMDVVVLKQGTLERDFQSLGTNYNPKDPFESKYLLHTVRDDGTIGPKASCPTKIFEKHYLYEAHFVAVLETDEDTAERIKDALRHPTWPIYLGRKCCLPAAPVFMGIHGDDWTGVLKNMTQDSELPYYAEDPEGMPYMDEPKGGMKFGTRYVSKTSIQI